MRVSAASVSSNPPPLTTEPATEPRKPTIYRRPEPIRAAVIGTGTIAVHHIEAVTGISGVKLAAICDLSPGVAECVAERFGIPRFFTNYKTMLDEVGPHVVHVTTPQLSHLRIACDALSSGAHVLVEKPITPSLQTWLELRDHAAKCERWVLEDQNYRFNPPMVRLRELIDSGRFGQVVHVDAKFCLDICGPGSVFADPNVPHASRKVAGGAIQDFLPHMVYLVYDLIGPHIRVESMWIKRDKSTVLAHDEMRAMVEARDGTATISFSSHAQPDGYWLTVHGTKMMARINGFDGRMSLAQQRGGGGPLMHLRNGISEGWSASSGSIRSLVGKLAGAPGAYEGLFELIRRLYAALAAGRDCPISIEQIDGSQRLLAALVSGAGS